MNNNLMYIARQINYWNKLENENQLEKINLKKNWQVTQGASASTAQAQRIENDIRIKPLEV